jgi:8-oxo-dGTP pyrophosphatase MutT (NUDIX family)
MIKQLPISFPIGRKTDVRTQFGALCFRVKKGKVQILLISSRVSKRWIIPKGWPMDGKTPAQAALTEAWEEAGVRGKSDGRCIGIFSYNKDTPEHGPLPCVAMVFPVEVTALVQEYPEARQRKRLWVSRKKAAKLVGEPELSRIMRDFDPRLTV